MNSIACGLDFTTSKYFQFVNCYVFCVKSCFFLNLLHNKKQFFLFFCLFLGWIDSCCHNQPMQDQDLALIRLVSASTSQQMHTYLSTVLWNPTIFNIICWISWLMGRTTHRPSVFFFIISYRLRALKTLHFYFCKFIKKYRKKLKWFLQRIL